MCVSHRASFFEVFRIHARTSHNAPVYLHVNIWIQHQIDGSASVWHFVLGESYYRYPRVARDPQLHVPLLPVKLSVENLHFLFKASTSEGLSASLIFVQQRVVEPVWYFGHIYAQNFGRELPHTGSDSVPGICYIKSLQAGQLAPLCREPCDPMRKNSEQDTIERDIYVTNVMWMLHDRHSWARAQNVTFCDCMWWNVTHMCATGGKTGHPCADCPLRNFLPFNFN